MYYFGYFRFFDLFLEFFDRIGIEKNNFGFSNFQLLAMIT